MPQLDNLLKALLEKGAFELRLDDGARPVFRFPQGDRPVSQTVLNRARIVALLSELTGGGPDAERLAAGDPVRFFYRLPDGKGFVCETGAAGAEVFARLSPSDEPEVPARPAPPPVASIPVSPAFTPEPPVPPAPVPVRVNPPRLSTAVDELLARMCDLKASDLHLSSCEAPMIRVHGEMTRLEGESAVSPERMAVMLRELMPERAIKQFEETKDTDFAHEIPGLARFRCNVFMDRLGMGAVIRVIPSRIPTAEELGIPKAVLDLCFIPKGLVLVTGPTGSGKSTTLAALIDFINSNRTDHIITIEEPIEFVHANRKCLINQREVGMHTQSFRTALRAALREDPDIVLVGEMRDLETIAIAIETAETGHLVFGTLHTSTAASTVDRIIDQFPADRQAQIRVMLGESLRGVVSQTLCKKVGGGRVAALEVLLGSLAIANLIREGKSFQIPSIMQTSRKQGMVLLNDALVDLVRRKVITPEEAWLRAIDKNGIQTALVPLGLRLPGAAAATPTLELSKTS